MSNSRLPVFSDLLLEDRHHTSLRAQYISEPYRHTPHPIRPRRQDQFSQPLTAAHHARWTHRLVGRDKQKALATGMLCCLQKREQPKYVIPYSLGRIRFHQGNVLVSCGIKDDLHAAVPKKSAHRWTIRYVRHAILYSVAILESVELQLEKEQGCLRLVETDQLCWCIIEDLATQFRTDRARGPGHHNHLVCKMPAHRLQIKSHGVAPQEVLQINITQLINRNPSFDEVAQARNRFEFPSARLAPLNDPAHSRAGHRRHGNKNLFDAVCGCHSGQFVNRPNNLDAVQANA